MPPFVEKRIIPETESIKKPDTTIERSAFNQLSETQDSLKKSEAVLGKNVPLKQRSEIREAQRSIKKTLVQLGAGLAMMLTAAGMSVSMRPERPVDNQETSSETLPEEIVEEEAEEPLEFSRPSRPHTERSEVTLSQNLLLELAQTLREYEMGIHRISPDEISREQGDIALENALAASGGRLSGPEIADHIREEIERTCSLPECNPEAALAHAANELGFRASGRDRYAVENIDNNYELLRANSELNGSGASLGYAMRVIPTRPDLFEEAIHDTLNRPDAGHALVDAMDFEGLGLFAMRMERLDEPSQAQIRDYINTERTNLNNELATLMAADRAAQERERTRLEILSDNPFATVEPAMTAEEQNRRENQIFQLNRRLRELDTFLNPVAQSEETPSGDESSPT